MPGVRPLPEEELDRRMRAVELIRSGTSECLSPHLSLHAVPPCASCFYAVIATQLHNLCSCMCSMLYSGSIRFNIWNSDDSASLNQMLLPAYL